MNHRHHAAVNMLLANGVPFLHIADGRFAKHRDRLDKVPRPLGWAKALNKGSICPCSVFLWHRFFPWTCGPWERCSMDSWGADGWWSRDWWQPCPTCGRCPYAYTEYGAFDHRSGWRWWRTPSWRRAPNVPLPRNESSTIIGYHDHRRSSDTTTIDGHCDSM